MINIKDTLILDDDIEYVVVSKADYNNKTYYYILNKYENSNYKFCYQENDELVEINDEKVIKEIIPLLFNNIKNEFIDMIS